ncbi:hypothetical protein LSAT2_030888 [Lamellibrachia satsuma]|nr:hypothetical protein LSAT2_030888 [Lamellibrachia satsuma]
MDSFEDNTAVLDVKKNFQMLLRSVEKDQSREACLEQGEQILKRARVEFETEVQAKKQRRQQLDRLLTTEGKCQEKLCKTKVHYEQKLLAAQRRQTKTDMAHEEKEQSLKAKIAELTTKNRSQQKDMNNLNSEVAEARRQVKLAFRKRDAAEKQVKQLTGCQTKLLQTELRIKELEAHVSQLTSDKSVSKNVKYSLLKLPKQEKDNTKLLQKNKSLNLHSTEETLRLTEERQTAAQEQLVKEQSTVQHHADFIKQVQPKFLFVTKAKAKVIHLSMNPATLAQQQQTAELAQLRTEVEQLRLKLQEKQFHPDEPCMDRTTIEPCTSKEITDFKAQLTSAELKNKQLMEAFKKTSQKFREVCYLLLGYRIDLVSDNQYKLQNMYAESPNDVLLFQETETGVMQILENTFSSSLSDKTTTYLQGADSIPAFLSSVTLELFRRQTMCVPP